MATPTIIAITIASATEILTAINIQHLVHPFLGLEVLVKSFSFFFDFFLDLALLPLTVYC